MQRIRPNRISLPNLKMGRPTPQSKATYQWQLAEFCQRIKELQCTLDFRMSARGWCYYLEGKGVITKGEFDQAQGIINNCRKSGMLPINICAVDERRSAEGIQPVNKEHDINDYARELIREQEDYLEDKIDMYNPYNFWDYQDNYVELLVEKIDLLGIFKPVCSEYYIPYGNRVGWGDINSNAALMKRFKYWENKGKQCILLYCGDHDPGGLHISDLIRKNLNDLSNNLEINWSPDNLKIERFGLNYDFIEANNLIWIDNLETSGKDEDGNPRHLDDPEHKDFSKPYVQDYINEYGVRKVEANALVSNIEAGRQLCKETILIYVNEDGITNYENAIEEAQDDLRNELEKLDK
jgi:hypothetical protein